MSKDNSATRLSRSRKRWNQVYGIATKRITAVGADTLTERKRGAELSCPSVQSEPSLFFNRVCGDVLTERIRQGRIHPRETPRQITNRTDRYLISSVASSQIRKAVVTGSIQDEYRETIQTIACLVASLEGMLERGEIS
jgi:hypothetical protein